MIMKIGSGDVKELLSGRQTKGYAKLWTKFVDENPPYYNAYASPIDALRTGAILEDNYLNFLEDGYYAQYKCQSKELDVFISTIDYAKVERGKIVDFDELKTIWLTDYLGIIRPAKLLNEKDQIEFIKKRFKSNYNQIQFQLYCSEIESANLSFLSVESYEDEVNKARIIKEKDVTKFTIHRDKKVIDIIKERGEAFQYVKNHFK